MITWNNLLFIHVRYCTCKNDFLVYLFICFNFISLQFSSFLSLSLSVCLSLTFSVINLTLNGDDQATYTYIVYVYILSSIVQGNKWNEINLMPFFPKITTIFTTFNYRYCKFTHIHTHEHKVPYRCGIILISTFSCLHIMFCFDDS